MSNIARQYNFRPEPAPFRPAIDPMRAPRIMHELRRLISIRDTGRDLEGEISLHTMDDVIDGINVAECALKLRLVVSQ